VPAASDPPGAAAFLDEFLREAVDLDEVGAHPLEHDLLVDVHHVPVADAVRVDDVHHLHAGAELAGLGDAGVDGDLRLREVLEHGGGHVAVRPGAVFLEDKDLVGGPGLLDLGDEGGGDLGAGLVGDERHPLRGLQPEADLDGVVRSADQGGIKAGRQRGGVRHV
jgi:hypothetical protein